MINAALTVTLLIPLASSLEAQSAEKSAFGQQIQALEWRCVGPHVGNRGAAVALHPTDKNLFYHGHSSGGVWKSDDAGNFWEPITDGQLNVGSIGAMALAASNPDIIYVGTGEPQLRCQTRFSKL